MHHITSDLGTFSLPSTLHIMALTMSKLVMVKNSLFLIMVLSFYTHHYLAFIFVMFYIALKILLMCYLFHNYLVIITVTFVLMTMVSMWRTKFRGGRSTNYQGPIDRSLYPICLVLPSSLSSNMSSKVSFLSNRASSDVWHRRLEHPSSMLQWAFFSIFPSSDFFFLEAITRFH